MKYKLLFLSLVFIFAAKTSAQSLTGMNGLLSIPTGELNADKAIVIGTNYFDKNFLDYTKEEHSAFAVYATYMFLPFLELGIRVTRIPNLPEGSQHNVDRMFSFRVQCLKQDTYLPSVSVGADNPFSTKEGANHFNSLYIASTKTFLLDSFIRSVSLTAGYGSDIISASDYEFVGIFGGVSFHVMNFLKLITEYDAKTVNGGFEVLLFNHVHLLACWKDYKYFNGGLGLEFNLGGCNLQ